MINFITSVILAILITTSDLIKLWVQFKFQVGPFPENYNYYNISFVYHF